jgi:hypothetical protein
MVELGTQTSYWETLLGALYAFASMGQLLPLTFSLLFGATKGSSISKSVVPYSRVPDVICTSAAVFTFPFIFQVAVLVQNVVGNMWTLLAICFMLIGILAKMNPRLMKALTDEQFKKSKFYLDTSAKVALVLAMVVFGVAIVTNGLLQATRRFLEDQGIVLSDEDKRALRNQFTWTCTRMGANVLGKSMISTVFFADGILSIMYKFHRGEDEDPLALHLGRMRLIADVQTIFEPKDSACEPAETQRVQPEPACGRGTDDTLGKVQALIDALKERRQAPLADGQLAVALAEAWASSLRSSHSAALLDNADALRTQQPSAPTSSESEVEKMEHDTREVLQWLVRRHGKTE